MNKRALQSVAVGLLFAVAAYIWLRQQTADPSAGIAEQVVDLELRIQEQQARNAVLFDSLVVSNIDPVTSIRIDVKHLNELSSYVAYFRKMVTEKVIHDLVIDPDSALFLHEGYVPETQIWLYGTDPDRKRTDAYSAVELQSRLISILTNLQSIPQLDLREVTASTLLELTVLEESGAWTGQHLNERSFEEVLYTCKVLVFQLEKLQEALILHFDSGNISWLPEWRASLQVSEPIS